MLNTENLKYYRKGMVQRETFEKFGCCHVLEVTKPVLEYIELVYHDGTRKYIYENQEGFDEVEQSFHSRRFNSFFTLLTTEEIAEEDRGFAKFKYYVRRDPADYIVMSLEEAEKELEGLPEKDPYVTELNHYDRKVDYHE